MASKLVFLAVLLAAIVAITTATYDECRVGRSIPYNPLPACQEYVRHQCANAPDTPELREPCCQQLRDLPKSCRCDALSIMARGVITEEGVRAGRIEAPAGCSREMMDDIASALPGNCNLQTAMSPIGYCPIWGGGID